MFGMINILISAMMFPSVRRLWTDFDDYHLLATAWKVNILSVVNTETPKSKQEVISVNVCIIWLSMWDSPKASPN